MQRYLRFYAERLGFPIVCRWVDNGRLRWVWLQRGDGAVMIQEMLVDSGVSARPRDVLGAGVTLFFVCDDALFVHRQAAERGLRSKRPFVGNGMWVVPFVDPDGYRIEFASPTDVLEETVYDEELHS